MKKTFEPNETRLQFHDKILVSEMDCEIFFNTLMNPREPNEELKKAVKEYNETFGKE